MINQKINRLTVLELSHIDNRHRKFYKVKCECGNESIVLGSAIRSGNTKSCGCLRKELDQNRPKLPNNAAVIHQIRLGYKRHANGRNIEYLLSDIEFENLIKQPCYYCGINYSNIKTTKNCKEGFKYNGIDRIDSTKHYTINNVVPCCGTCNIAKMRMSKEDFLKWIESVYNHSIKNKNDTV